MRRELEALLFATDQPLTLAKLASLFPDADRKELRAELESLREEYDREQRGFTLVEFGGGYSIATRPEYAKLVRKLYRGRRKARLSKPALECLAIVAYKQPVTRLEIEEIRGVSVQGVVGTLLERDLIAIVGRAETLGHPLLYGTTRTFLDYLGLKNIKELPQLSELEDILSRREELKQLAASTFGDRLTEEDLEETLAAPADEDEEEDAPEEASDDADEPQAEAAEDAPRADSLEEAQTAPAAVAESSPGGPEADEDPPTEAKAARAATNGGAD
jgi:segregation and condensation protein B